MASIGIVLVFIVSVIVSCGGSTGQAGGNRGEAGKGSAAAAAAPAADLIRVLSPVPDEEIAAGSVIRVAFENKGAVSPDSVEIYFGGRITGTVRAGNNSFIIPYEHTATTGIKPLRLLAYSGNERPQSVSMFIKVLSDIEPARYGYRVEKVFPHDSEAYTQGLFFHGGFLYEGTGQLGKSSLRKVDLESGAVIRRLNLDSQFFGEGIAMSGDRIYQLTWKNKIGFIYEPDTFRETGRFYYSTEGWGLASMGSHLVMSDGTNKLYVIDPEGFITARTIEVYDNRSMVMYLNELEYVNGEIWANVFTTDLIARIDPASGRVLGYIDLRGIMPNSERRNDGDDVLNGIAFDPGTGRIWITGKNWPKLFQIRVTGPN